MEIRRAVAIAAVIPALVLVAACAAPPPASSARTSPCAVDRTQATAETPDPDAFRERVERGTLHRALVEAHGPAGSCSVVASGPVLVASYSFPDGGRLEVRSDTTIEHEVTEATIRLADREKALDLLRGVERELFPPSGCGIAWDAPETEPGPGGEGQEAVFQGEDCNCRASVSDPAGGLIRLRFSSAC